MTVEELIAKLQTMPQQATVQLTIDSSMEYVRVWSIGEEEFSVTKESDDIVDIYAEDKLD